MCWRAAEKAAWDLWHASVPLPFLSPPFLLLLPVHQALLQLNPLHLHGTPPPPPVPHPPPRLQWYHHSNPHALSRTGVDGRPRLPVPVMLAFGGVAGLVAQTVTYPLDVVRRQMQVRPGAVPRDARQAVPERCGGKLRLPALCRTPAGCSPCCACISLNRFLSSCLTTRRWKA